MKVRSFTYHVSFRVFHPTIDPKEVCNELGMEAETMWKAGEPRQTPKGTPLAGVYESSYCSFELKHSGSVNLSSFLKRATRNLSKRKRILEHIRSTGGRSEYFIGWFANRDSGETFDFDLIGDLAALKIDLSLAVYPPEKAPGSVGSKGGHQGQPQISKGARGTGVNK
jgi:hypothetical protein